MELFARVFHAQEIRFYDHYLLGNFWNVPLQRSYRGAGHREQHSSETLTRQRRKRQKIDRRKRVGLSLCSATTICELRSSAAFEVLIQGSKGPIVYQTRGPSFCMDCMYAGVMDMQSELATPDAISGRSVRADNSCTVEIKIKKRWIERTEPREEDKREEEICEKESVQREIEKERSGEEKHQAPAQEY
ncbi:hypothetical protein SBOR_9129 [Sclerotinia borealis F-4128]|uniref:Uncharacterized protein n=1 Tax=Sclerotinia borealis (strain F-4128) TaxID=1432307 RepID=W9C7D9_SCLBF|nr:hypothetical protein SBOR_9129 [Sclerotinia borealis F-4128]